MSPPQHLNFNAAPAQSLCIGSMMLVYFRPPYFGFGRQFVSNQDLPFLSAQFRPIYGWSCPDETDHIFWKGSTNRPRPHRLWGSRPHHHWPQKTRALNARKSNSPPTHHFITVAIKFSYSLPSSQLCCTTTNSRGSRDVGALWHQMQEFCVLQESMNCKIHDMLSEIKNLFYCFRLSKDD